MKMSSHENPKQFPALAPGPRRMFAPQMSTAVNLLESLLSTLASDDQLQFDKVLNLIRKKATFQDLAHAIGRPATTFGDAEELSNANTWALLDNGEPIETVGNGVRRLSSPGTIASSPEEIPYMKPPQRPTVSPYARVTLESLCDMPLFKVPANPWTKVTDNDYLVSHLVSLYFTWDHPCSQFLDQGIFLEHMKLGDQRSEFCTPLLVNSLLSMASAYSDSPDVLSTPENLFSRGHNFFHEAQRLWEVEDDDHDLPNIQALLMMCCVFKCQGRARKSWMMLSQAVQLAGDIGLYDAPSVSNKKILPEMERVRTITAWAVFNMSTQMSIELQKIAPLAYPTSDVKLCGNEDFDWTPYPRSNSITYDKKPALLPEVREGLAEVARILVDIQKLVSEKTKGATFEDLWSKAHGPFNRLKDWLQRWPGVPEIQRNSVPQVLLLRIKCLQAIIYLFEMLKDPHEPRLVRQARLYQVKFVEEMAHCLCIHRQSYGLKHIPSQIVDAIQTGLRILAYQLEESDQSRQAFAELCRFGIALSRRFKQTADAVHEVGKNALHLGPEVVAVFDDPEQWRGLEP
ncbi:hypothetical protein PDIDSM_4247 [Penicillium digitatum]|nr:hypothetical protein PDIDSM_4247 [Penicillium digitatum]